MPWSIEVPHAYEIVKMSWNGRVSNNVLTWLYKHRKPTWRTQPRQLLVLQWNQRGSQHPQLWRRSSKLPPLRHLSSFEFWIGGGNERTNNKMMPTGTYIWSFGEDSRKSAKSATNSHTSSETPSAESKSMNWSATCLQPTKTIVVMSGKSLIRTKSI